MKQMDDVPESDDELLSQAMEEWGSDQFVNLSPVWRGRPRSNYLVELLAQRRRAESELIKRLEDEHPLIVGYCLVTLLKMDSSCFENLPQSLSKRTELITQLQGSFGLELHLSEFAAEIQQEWLHRRQRTVE